MSSISLTIKQEINKYYKPEHYPALTVQTGKFKDATNLRGLRVLDATPVFRNTLVKYIPMLEAGIHLSVGISNVIAHDTKIVEFLESIGIEVVTPEMAAKLNFDVILDCAGVFSKIDARLGYSELTRSGISKYANCKKPVLCADNGRIKRIETILGTGESLFRALEHLGHRDFCTKKIVLFGTGKVGRGIIIYAKAAGAHITAITDLPSVDNAIKQYCTKIIDYHDTESVINELQDAWLITTATGIKNAHANPELSHAIINSPALLANMGVEDEFGELIPPERALNNKLPVNFILEEPTHLKYIDATMALHNEGITEALKENHANGAFDPSIELEKALLSIVERNGIITDELSLVNY